MNRFFNGSSKLNLILEDTELKRKLVDCAETFPDIPDVSQIFGGPSVRCVSWSEVAMIPKRKSHRGLDLNLSLNSEVNIWKGWKENSGMK